MTRPRKPTTKRMCDWPPCTNPVAKASAWKGGGGALYCSAEHRHYVERIGWKQNENRRRHT